MYNSFKLWFLFPGTDSLERGTLVLNVVVGAYLVSLIALDSEATDNQQ